MPGLIGRKIGMTNVFDDNRRNIPCTVVECGPCVVTQVKTPETDGYEAVQIGFGAAKEKHVANPQLGHFKRAGVEPLRTMHEFDLDVESYKPGDVVKVDDVFNEGDFVDVVGTSKGKGFQGVVKRYGFRGVGDKTHGQNDRLRAPGSVGGASDPSRVFKGIKMAGQMGNKRVKIDNLRVVQVIPEKNVLVLSGALPGAKDGILFIEK